MEVVSHLILFFILSFSSNFSLNCHSLFSEFIGYFLVWSTSSVIWIGAFIYWYWLKGNGWTCGEVIKGSGTIDESSSPLYTLEVRTHLRLIAANYFNYAVPLTSSKQNQIWIVNRPFLVGKGAKNSYNNQLKKCSIQLHKTTLVFPAIPPAVNRKVERLLILKRLSAFNHRSFLSAFRFKFRQNLISPGLSAEIRLILEQSLPFLLQWIFSLKRCVALSPPANEVWGKVMFLHLSVCP